MLVNSMQAMSEPISFDLDYQHMNGFGGLLSPMANTGPHEMTIKSEDELTLLNISSNKPMMTNNPPAATTTTTASHSPPDNIDHLLKIIESNEKHNERMVMQYRLKQVLLDYLKTKHCPTQTANAGNGCQQQNHMQALDNDCQRVPTILSDRENPMISGYPSGGQSPPTLTPPISPDIGQQFFISSGVEQKTIANMQLIGLHSNGGEALECQQLSETIESLYSSESEEQHNNHMSSIEESAEDEELDIDENNRIETCFDETFDYPSNCSTYSNTTSQSSPTYAANSSVSPIHETSTKRSTARAVNEYGRGGRKTSTQSSPDGSLAAQKRSAHLSAEFRYRTKLNDKISKLRNIVGPKSQLSKSGVLSRSIDLIAKLQKSNVKLREENKRMRVLLMQACNQVPGSATMAQASQPLFIQ